MAEALTADPDELERMGRAGAARVAEQHNVITETQKFADLFSNSGDRAMEPTDIAGHGSSTWPSAQ